MLISKELSKVRATMANELTEVTLSDLTALYDTHKETPKEKRPALMPGVSSFKDPNKSAIKSNVATTSGVHFIDIDGVQDVKPIIATLKEQYISTKMTIMQSSSGGLHVYFYSACQGVDHFKVVQDYLIHMLGVVLAHHQCKVDKQCINVNRWQYLPKATLWHQDGKLIEVPPFWEPPCSPNKADTRDFSKYEGYDKKETKESIRHEAFMLHLYELLNHRVNGVAKDNFIHIGGLYGKYQRACSKAATRVLSRATFKKYILLALQRGTIEVQDSIVKIYVDKSNKLNLVGKLRSQSLADNELAISFTRMLRLGLHRKSRSIGTKEGSTLVFTPSTVDKKGSRKGKVERYCCDTLSWVELGILWGCSQEVVAKRLKRMVKLEWLARERVNERVTQWPAIIGANVWVDKNDPSKVYKRKNNKYTFKVLPEDLVESGVFDDRFVKSLFNLGVSPNAILTAVSRYLQSGRSEWKPGRSTRLKMYQDLFTRQSKVTLSHTLKVCELAKTLVDDLVKESLSRRLREKGIVKPDKELMRANLMKAKYEAVERSLRLANERIATEYSSFKLRPSTLKGASLLEALKVTNLSIATFKEAFSGSYLAESPETVDVMMAGI